MHAREGASMDMRCAFRGVSWRFDEGVLKFTMDLMVTVCIASGVDSRARHIWLVHLGTCYSWHLPRTTGMETDRQTCVWFLVGASSDLLCLGYALEVGSLEGEHLVGTVG
jgi:hypothetical protein